MLQCSTAEKHTEKQRDAVILPRAGNARSPKSDERLVGLVMKRAATVSTVSSVLRGKVGLMLNSEQKPLDFLVHSSLTLILSSESTQTDIQR